MHEFLQTKVGRILISILWGFGLATFFRKTCRNNKCIVVRIANKDMLENNNFNYQGSDTCYDYKPKITKCS